jgi:hypothetical protein
LQTLNATENKITKRNTPLVNTSPYPQRVSFVKFEKDDHCDTFFKRRNSAFITHSNSTSSLKVINHPNSCKIIKKSSYFRRTEDIDKPQIDQPFSVVESPILSSNKLISLQPCPDEGTDDEIPKIINRHNSLFRRVSRFNLKTSENRKLLKDEKSYEFLDENLSESSEFDNTSLSFKKKSSLLFDEDIDNEEESNFRPMQISDYLEAFNESSSDDNNAPNTALTNFQESTTPAQISINDFEFKANIGKGGFGSVDLFMKKSTKDMYAIKSVNLKAMVRI